MPLFKGTLSPDHHFFTYEIAQLHPTAARFPHAFVVPTRWLIERTSDGCEEEMFDGYVLASDIQETKVILRLEHAALVRLSASDLLHNVVDLKDLDFHIDCEYACFIRILNSYSLSIHHLPDGCSRKHSPHNSCWTTMLPNSSKLMER